MKLPWQNREIRQQASNYTDAIIAQLTADASGSATNVGGLGALEICAGLWGRAFMAATVSPDTIATRALTPSIMQLIGRELVKNGAALFEIMVEDGIVGLMPASYWDVYGHTSNPMEWTYRATTVGPDNTTTKYLTGARVVHPRYGTSPADSWVGVAPMNRALVTGKLVGTLEARLSQEIGGPVGSVMPLPSGQRDALKNDLKGLKGGMALVDTVADWATTLASKPGSDWVQKRIGADPPSSLIALRRDLTMEIFDACGVPASLASGGSDGTAQREAYRRFAANTIQPVLGLVAEELALKLDVPGLKFDVSGLYANDMVGRSTAFRNMVNGGMDVTQALGISGLMIED